MFRISTPILILLVSQTVFSAPPLEVTTCSSCSECSSLLNSGAWDVVQLDTDLVNVGGACIQIFGASSVVFDCDGHVIDGDDVSIDPEYGIHVYGASFEITVRNCTVSDFSAGIQLWSASNCTVEDSVFVSNGVGIVAAFLTGTDLRSNISADNFTGLNILDSADNNSFDFLDSCGNSVADIHDEGASGNSGVCTRCGTPGNWNGSPSDGPMCWFGCDHIFSQGFEFQIECWDWSTWVGSVL